MTAIVQIPPAPAGERVPAPRSAPRARPELVPGPGGHLRPARAVVAVVVVVLLGVLGLLSTRIIVSTAAVGDMVEPASGEYHVVTEGDTLYSVARGWAPGVPVADTIACIESLNGGIDAIVPGMVISLPAKDR